MSDECDEELEDKKDGFYILKTIDRTKPKNKRAFLSLKDYFDRKDEMTLECLHEIESKISKLEEKLDKHQHISSVKADSSEIITGFTADRAFSKRWPWISIDCKTRVVKCSRCGQYEQCNQFQGFSGDNFTWFMGTHGACQDKINKP